MATATVFDAEECTHDAYQSLLGELRDRYTSRPFSADPASGNLVLEHDVSLSLDDAVLMAKEESELGLTGTYCVLLTSPLFNPLDPEQAEKIRRIESYGHEIGLQINPATAWDKRPSESAIESTVADRRAVLETIASEPSSVVSFYRPPAWLIGRQFSTFQSTLESAESSTMTVVTDSPAIRSDGESTLETFPDSLHLLVHPERWNSNHADHERIVEGCVIDSCRYVNRRARAEFVDPFKHI